MNNLFKQFKSNKKVLWIVLTVVLIITLSLAFFLTRKKANSLISDKILEQSESEQLSLFSSYECINGSVIKLFENKSGSYVFIDEKGDKIYTTEDNVQYFRMLDEKSLVYVVSKFDSEANKISQEVKFTNLDNLNTVTIYSGENILLEVANGTIYILNYTNGDFLYGTFDNLSKSTIGKPISKVVCNKGHLFVINYSVINSLIRSTIYSIDNEKIEEVSLVEGEVQSITVDYDNDNLIYYSTSVLNSDSSGSKIFVYSKYLKDLSPNSSGLKRYTNLNSNIISLKDRYITLDTENNSVVLLNSNFSKVKVINYYHKDSLKSLIKESSNSEKIFFIDQSGKLISE